MKPNTEIINRFYTAFTEKDFKTMQSCYHPKATFSDSVFINLNSREVKAMWEMLLTSGSDLRIEFGDVKADGDKGSAHWEAWYTFSTSGNKVHNVIDADFEFKDELIFRHKDYFDFFRWSRQALGVKGLLLGWTSFLKNKVRETARKRLNAFISKNEK
jgi:hypothetical protein